MMHLGTLAGLTPHVPARTQRSAGEWLGENSAASRREFTTNWIKTHDADAAQLGKPLYLGEFSLPDSPVDEADVERRNELCARAPSPQRRPHSHAFALVLT